MSVVPLLLLFLIWKVWSPDQAPRPLVSPLNGLSIFVIGYTSMIFAMRFWSTWLSGKVQSHKIERSLKWFNISMDIARLFIPAWFGVGVFLLGWAGWVARVLSPIANWPAELPSTLVGLSPGIFAWMALWWSQFPADRAIREQNLLTRINNSLPVFSSSNFRSYFGNKLRIQLLFTIIPVLTIMALHDGVMTSIWLYCRAKVHVPNLSDEVESLIWICCAGSVFLFAPEVLRRVLHTQRLPDSQLRIRLEEMCESAGMRCREILLWRTHNNTGNAAVMGLLPQVRYVLLSDLLLESMTDEQIEAVFAHELGHVKHRHMVWYIVFFIAMSSIVYAAGESAHRFIKISEQYFQLIVTVIYAGLFWLGFGYVSRWFERQADVFAARTMQQSSLAGKSLVGPAGAKVFSSALQRVALVNNIPITAPNWTHGSIATRMRYIRKIGRDPILTDRFDRSIRLFYIVMTVTLLTSGTCALQVARTESAPVSATPIPPASLPSAAGATEHLLPAAD